MSELINNHFYPKCLTKQWSTTKDSFVTRTYISQIYPKGKMTEQKSVRSVLYRKGAYNQYTENFTANDDSTFAELIRKLHASSQVNDIESMGQVLIDCVMRQLLYKLLLRQPSLNNSIIQTALTELQHQPYLMCSVNNPFISPSQDTLLTFEQWANTSLFASNPDSGEYEKFCYRLIVNHSRTPFILADDTKPERLIVSLSPTMMMHYVLKSAFKSLHSAPDARIDFITTDVEIARYNLALKQNCNAYYISTETL